MELRRKFCRCPPASVGADIDAVTSADVNLSLSNKNIWLWKSGYSEPVIRGNWNQKVQLKGEFSPLRETDLDILLKLSTKPYVF